jgi:hypothetical protein
MQLARVPPVSSVPALLVRVRLPSSVQQPQPSPPPSSSPAQPLASCPILFHAT